MNRRNFLILGGLSTAGVLAGSAAFRIGGIWWDQDTSSSHQILSAQEVRISESIVDALFPGDHLGMPNGNEVGVVAVFDDYLGALDEHRANLLRLLLHAIDDLAITAGLAMTRFHLRPREERIDILNGWDRSRIGPRREVFKALKLIFSMGYCESPRVLRAAQIDYECGDIS
jgi:hypothetical protein